MTIPHVRQLAIFALFALFASRVLALDEFERPPIEYSRQAPNNPISKLQSRLNKNEVTLEYDDRLGYLPALLSALEVPVESQMLVFSKTSLQRQRISPRNPRAIYFNENVYIGFCQSGEMLEISTADPKLGAVFYTVEQKPAKEPKFQRQTDNCLICHSSSRTEGVPGHLVRSLFVGASGEPRLSEGSFSVDHTTPLENRWGGWYVTGTHGSQSHLGNLILSAKTSTRPAENEAGHNVLDVSERFSAEKYPSPHSDIVALMVFEHQTYVHNRLTKANFATRRALYYEAELNRALGEPGDNRLDSTTRQIQSVGDALVEALLLTGEASLTAPISGTSDFRLVFTQRAVRDRKGRSLRDLDLERRLFKYPCSYLIYSPAFDELPSEMRDYVWKRLWGILTAEGSVKQFAHLSAEDKKAIIEIVRDTKDVPDYWK